MYVSYFFISQDMYVMSLKKKQISVIRAVLSSVIEFICSFIEGNDKDIIYTMGNASF